jgi:hypothetical protein
MVFATKASKSPLPHILPQIILSSICISKTRSCHEFFFGKLKKPYFFAAYKKGFQC